MSELSLNKLKTIIDASGFKKVFIATKLSMPPNTLYCKLMGRRKFSNAELGIIADVLDVGIQEFFEEGGR